MVLFFFNAHFLNQREEYIHTLFLFAFFSKKQVYRPTRIVIHIYHALHQSYYWLQKGLCWFKFSITQPVIRK